MAVIWIAFGATAVLVAAGGLAALRAEGEAGPVLRLAGRFLLALAIGTAVFPALLPLLGAGAWVKGYIGFVAAFTAVLTVCAVAKARSDVAR